VGYFSRALKAGWWRGGRKGEALAELRRVCILDIVSRPVRRSPHTPSSPKGPKPRARVVTATAAVRRFADLVEDVRRTGRAWTVTHHGRAVCAIGPAQPGSATFAALVDALKAGPQPDAGLAAAVRRAARSQARVEPPRWVG